MSGLGHTVQGTSGNVHDVLEGNSVLHGQEIDAYGDACYQCIHKRPDAKLGVRWHVAMRPCKRWPLDKSDSLDRLTDQVKKAKAGIRSKVEYPFRVIKRQFRYCFDKKFSKMLNMAKIGEKFIKELFKNCCTFNKFN